MNASNNPASNVSPLSNIVAAIMRDAATQGNRQAAFTVAMFASEVTFSANEILKVFKTEGQKRTLAIDTLLCDVSEDYENILRTYERITAKDFRKVLGKELPLEQQKKAIERNVAEAKAMELKIRAARKMFTLAMAATYHLRRNKVESVSTNNVGVGGLIVRMKVDGDIERMNVTNVSLVNAGNKAIAETLGKKPKEERGSTAKNPAADILSNASKSLASIVNVLLEPVSNGNGKIAAAGQESKFDALSADERKNLDVIFRNLFVANFFDGDKFDNATFKEWLATEFPPKPKAEKPAEPKQEVKPENKAA